MSIPRLAAIVLLIIFSGGGILAMLRSLLRRAADPYESGNSIGGIGSTVLGVALFLTLWYGFAFMDPPVLFMRALREGDDRAAFGLLRESLQTELDGYEGFTAWADAMRPKRWFFMSSCSTFDLGRSDGTGRFVDGERFSVTFDLRKEDGRWLIQGIRFWELEPRYWVGQSSGLDCSD